MRAVLCGILAAITFASVGCHPQTRPNGCQGGHGGCQSCGHAHGGRAGMPSPVANIPHGTLQQQMAGPPGPQGPSVAYPYYTTRAPRDFLMNNPPSIGP